MSHPFLSRVVGPLAVHGTGVVAELERRGYAEATIANQVKLLVNLSRWMTAEGLAAEDLSPEVVERYVAWRKASGYRHFRTVRALEPLVAYLHAAGVLPAPAGATAVAPVELLAERYRGYLAHERGLAPTTVRCYLSIAQRFLVAHEEVVELHVKIRNVNGQPKQVWGNFANSGCAHSQTKGCATSIAFMILIPGE